MGQDDSQNPERQGMQPPIPTHPADPAAAGDADKIVGGSPASRGSSDTPVAGTGMSSGASLDHAGGAGLGQPPGGSDIKGVSPNTARSQDSKAEDLQDRRDTP
jgi:hypothetical protein